MYEHCAAILAWPGRSPPLDPQVGSFLVELANGAFPWQL
jgi:hypothetical protein